MKKNRFVLMKFIKLCFKAYKPYFVILFFDSLLKAFEFVFNAYAISILINYLETAVYTKGLACGGIIVLINLCFYFFNKLLARFREPMEIKMNNKLEQKIMDKLMNLDYEKLEDPECLDLKERARMGVNNFGAINRIINNLFLLMQNILVIASLGSIIALFDYSLIIILGVAILINIIIVLLTTKTTIKFYNELIPINRRFGYYIDTILDPTKAKDYRMYDNIADMMKNKYIKYENETINQFSKVYLKYGFFETMQKIISYLELFFIYIIIVKRVINNNLSIATFSLYVASAISFSKCVISLIGNTTGLIECKAYVIPLIELMNLKNNSSNSGNIKLEQEIDTIEFKNVSFKYPKSDVVIINNISFKINKGEKISIVGLNGAGKTTLVKLIARLYLPTSGEILINGVNINCYEIKSYLKQISTVFQDYKLFAYSLMENINCNDQDKAYDILKSVGLKDKIDCLPKGVNSIYSKSYCDEGIELSGGESQKIAIARAISADSSLVILDEPTSALDPLAEAEIYENFNKLVKGKTAIYISHRMSSSVFCDKILVLDNKIIADYDTHENLMKKKDSLYYKLFNLQAKNYSN